MGDIIYPPPSEFPPGEDCVTCTPTLYPADGWPSILYAIFTGVTPCAGRPPIPNDHPFMLHQTANPCEYLFQGMYAGYELWILLELQLARLRWNNLDEPPGGIFYGLADQCTLDFPTNLYTCPVEIAESGSARIVETPTPLTSLLCSDYSLMPWGKFEHGSIELVHQTRSESQPVAMDHELVRLANKRDHSCCYFYIDREDLP